LKSILLNPKKYSLPVPSDLEFSPPNNFYEPDLWRAGEVSDLPFKQGFHMREFINKFVQKFSLSTSSPNVARQKALLKGDVEAWVHMKNDINQAGLQHMLIPQEGT